MSRVINFIKIFKTRSISTTPRKLQLAQCLQHWRGFADTPTSDSTTKQIVVQGTDKEERLRVRRARPADVPRVLRFVRENARVAWPNFVSRHSNFNLILGDYVTRALAQGHSMLAEQQEARRGWSQIRGLAISTTVCPWDSAMLEQWARCVKCKRARQLVHFTAHCLRAPGLHDKYGVHNILQVILLVPLEVPRSSEIAQMLAKNTLKRGREVGLPVLRFDVTSDSVAKALEDLNLVKEWELSYEMLPDALQERKEAIQRMAAEVVATEQGLTVKEKEDEPDNREDTKSQDKGHFIAVYTANNHSTQ